MLTEMMQEIVRRLIAGALCVAIAALPVLDEQVWAQETSVHTEQTQAAQQPVPDMPSTLRPYLDKHYAELFRIAPTVHFTQQQYEQQRETLKRGEDACRKRFKNDASNFGKNVERARNDLKKARASLTDAQRHELHCTIQNQEMMRSEAQMLYEHAIPTAYDNLYAKLDLLQNWPAEYRATQAEITTGAYHNRKWGDVKDIGFREIAPGQEKDIKRGQDAVRELRRIGLLPPELQNKAIQSYVRSVGARVARNSDLRVPLHITVLQSKEINAFALPGGYLFVERGLLEAADNESELAGVIAHEIAHDTARHSAKLMKRATIASIFYQAAQVAAIILTGGVAGIGMYYALQYGFYGLGLVLNLKLLGVSRDYEIEADQLGVQYAWKAGYDPKGFLNFFDKMATKAGYVNGVSWFRTHPPFYQRMLLTEQEIMYLPKQENPTVQTDAFLEMKKELKPITLAQEKEEKGKPSLMLSRETGCAPPPKIEYKPGQPIEQLCTAPRPTEASIGEGASGAGSQ